MTTYKLNELTLIDPEIIVLAVKYELPKKSAVITIELKSDTYDHIRELPAIPYTDYLTDEEILGVVMDALESRLNTPPESNGYYIVIPEQFHWAFPIKIAGFECPMIDRDDKKVVEASYLTWAAFLDEFDKPGYADLKSALYPIFEYAKTNPEIIQ